MIGGGREKWGKEEEKVVICFGELVPGDAVEGILFKWVTEAAETDIYHT